MKLSNHEIQAQHLKHWEECGYTDLADFAFHNVILNDGSHSLYFEMKTDDNPELIRRNDGTYDLNVMPYPGAVSYTAAYGSTIACGIDSHQLAHWDGKIWKK